MLVVCERLSWRRGQTTTYWTKFFRPIAALLSHLGLVAQPWVTEVPKPCVCRWFSIRHLVSNWLQLNWLKPSVSWLYFCLTSTCFCCSSAVFPLIYTSASLYWLIGRGSICYKKSSWKINFNRKFRDTKLKSNKITTNHQDI